MGLLWYSQLMETMQHAIQMHTPVGKGLLNRLFKKGGRVLLMQLQNTHKLLYASASRPFLFEVSKDAMVGCRPIFAPAFDWCGVVKGTWSLFKQGKIVQRIKNILLPFVASGMMGKEFCFVVNVNMKRIGFQRDFFSCPTDRNRVAVGFKRRLAVGGQA